MNNELKLFIYEACANGDIDIDVAKKLVGNTDETSILESQYLSAMNDIDIAESAFMESALQYASGDTTQAVFEKSAESIGKKIAAAWEKFKKWVKSLWEKIISKFKKHPKEKKIKVPKSALDLLKSAEKVTAKAVNGINNFLHNGYGKSEAEMNERLKDIDDQPWWKDVLNLTASIATIGFDAWAISYSAKVCIEMAPLALLAIILGIQKSINAIIGAVDKFKETRFAKTVSYKLHRILVFIQAAPQCFSNKPEVVEQVPEDKVEIITDKDKL
jgi:hypothetical protein